MSSPMPRPDRPVATGTAPEAATDPAPATTDHADTTAAGADEAATDEAATDEATSAPDAFRPLPDEWHRRTKLRDGTRVLLRQIRPSDRDRLQAGMQRLSAASRYLRFHANVTELSDEQLDYLTRVDHVDHEALVALDLDHRDRPGIGVARYIREPYEPEIAEAAITVVDDYHGQGVGTILLGALAARARSNGVTVFRNYVLEGNHAMLEVFDHLGAQRHWQPESGLWCVDLRVPSSEDEGLPDSPAGRAFLHAAQATRSGGGRLVQLFPPVWELLRRRGSRDEPIVSPDAEDPLVDAFRDHGLDDPRRRR